MDFGSKYVYKYEHSSDESISDSDDEPTVLLQSAALALPSSPTAPPPPSIAGPALEKRKRRLRKADTNVLSVKFNRLLQPGEMHAGDPVYCTTCGAIASHLSKVQAEGGEEAAAAGAGSKWQCEFCPQLNTVDIEQTDLPKQEDATYLISPAPAVHGSDMTGIDDSLVIFLIDVSGSMSSTTLVNGAFHLPNAAKMQERAAAQFDGERLRKERGQTYVTRLQGVQMAVDANLDKLVKDSPTRRAAVLSFNHEITYYGDGTRVEPLVIRGDKLDNAEDLLREAERELNTELKSILETKAQLTERVYDLEEGGQTALGPAVLFALHIASKRAGSKVVICTDGLANRGLGSLETAQDDRVDRAVQMEALENGNRYYAELTERAREKGVSISVITIKGTTCLLPVIGQMADGTGGNVTIVDLLNIRDEFASILEQKVIATNVEATLIVHRGLYIRDPDDSEAKLEKIKRDIGNVTTQTEVSFEFGIRNKEELKEKYHIDLDQLQKLPFQVQVTYTASDGSKALRVLTQLKEATENREIAEINAYRGVIAENHIRSTATDVMVAYDDDDDDDEDDDEESGKMRRRSKWSSPLMQKQRVAYMTNLNSHKHRFQAEASDRFNESGWDKASSDLRSHVVSSKAKKSSAPTYGRGQASKPAPSIFSRVTRLITGSSGEPVAEEEEVEASASAAAAPKRKYGFATSKLALHTDKGSEDLFRYKNFSSDRFRSSSPTGEENQTATASGSASSTTSKKDEDDKKKAAEKK